MPARSEGLKNSSVDEAPDRHGRNAQGMSDFFHAPGETWNDGWIVCCFCCWLHGRGVLFEVLRPFPLSCPLACGSSPGSLLTSQRITLRKSSKSSSDTRIFPRGCRRWQQSLPARISRRRLQSEIAVLRPTSDIDSNVLSFMVILWKPTHDLLTDSRFRPPSSHSVLWDFCPQKVY